jgi:hypothetical protein
MENLPEQNIKAQRKYHLGLILAIFSLVVICLTFFDIFGRHFQLGFVVGFTGLIVGIILAKIAQKNRPDLAASKSVHSLVVSTSIITAIILISIIGLFFGFIYMISSIN